ncbi:membrane protein insertase YidC [Bacteroidales bacterium OttesenSCG-928-I21]|nr:membrane protein insertase YidC [Bacteroidales bacterium OttesenSCG-928-I21]
MDKSSIIGLILIGLVFVGYYFITKPSEAEIAQMRHRQDSVVKIRQSEDSLKKIQEQMLTEKEQNKLTESIITESSIELTQEQIDSIENYKLTSQYGIFKNAAQGYQKFISIENEKMILTLTNKGGKIYSVELKEYKTHDSLPLVLFVNDENSVFGMEMIAEGKALITNEMFFTPSLHEEHIVVKDKPVSINMRLKASEYKYIEYQYVISPDDYMIDFDINFVGLSRELEMNPYISFKWGALAPSLERGKDWESNNTTVFLKMSDGELENLSETKDADKFSSRGSAKWIAHKQQFFSSILIAKDKLENPTSEIKKITNPESKFIKGFYSEFTLSLDESDNQSQKFNFYFGPNKFSTLKKYDLELEKVIYLGWGIISWVNRFLIIPVFNFLGRFIGNYGLIILLLTIFIKLIIFPFTYKTYMSSAKMRVLKPQIDALNEKYPPGKEMEKQQATMALYKKVGVNPMGGCLPMLFQFPILVAMFRFFPTSIELRQEKFLWANDLSSYDSILDLPFNIPLYGDHISLFTLLMAASMVLSTKLTSSSQPQNNSMPGMKIMMYMMPVMMVLWFNNYSSGLSYYYLLANLITILQTWVMQKFIVDEKKVLEQLEANKKKEKPKSKWQQRIEEAQRQQQQLQKQQKNKR